MRTRRGFVLALPLAVGALAPGPDPLCDDVLNPGGGSAPAFEP